jgi:hypothetical protein
MKKLFSIIALGTGLFLSMSAHAQFQPTAAYTTYNTQCGTYFKVGSTYYDSTGASVGSTLPFCGGSLSTQNSNSVLMQPAKYTNALLPTCNASSSGLIVIETDGAATPVYAATATGGGTLAVPVMCTNSNGSFSWTNH